jgi:NAD-dependent DNA ligase
LGKPSLKEIIASHGGIIDDKVQGRTNILVIGDHPGKVKVRDAKKQAVQIVHIYTLEGYLGGTMTFKEPIETPPP